MTEKIDVESLKALEAKATEAEHNFANPRKWKAPQTLVASVLQPITWVETATLRALLAAYEAHDAVVRERDEAREDAGNWKARFNDAQKSNDELFEKLNGSPLAEERWGEALASRDATIATLREALERIDHMRAACRSADHDECVQMFGECLDIARTALNSARSA